MIFPTDGSPVTPFVLATVLLVFALSFLFVGRFIYFKEEGEEFYFGSSFPFELCLRKDKKASLTIFAIYLLAALSSLGLAYFFAKSFFLMPRGHFVLGILAALLLLSKSVSLAFMLILPAYYHKAHNILDAISYSSCSMSMSISGYFLFKVNGVLRGASFFLSFIATVIGFLIFLLMLSPKYKDWTKLSHKEENGEIKVERPRFFLLAASEWALYALTLAGDLVLYLSLGFLMLEI